MKESTFFKEGITYQPSIDNPRSRFPKLPVGTYLVRASMERGFYLEEFPKFDVPETLYGNITKQAGRILNTFGDRPRTTGVLLSGEKGSGKTLLARLLSIKGLELGLPTIVVNSPFTGDAFNTFLQSIEQPAILLFDEFEKVYDKDENQPKLLSLFDGLFTTQKLIILTANEVARVNPHFLNRPGRIYYCLDFKGLDREFIVEYGQDKLKNQKHLVSLGVIASMINPLSFDALQAIVEEANRYDEVPTKTLDMVNVKSVSYRETFLGTLKPTKKHVVTGYNTTNSDRMILEFMADPYKSFVVHYYYKTGRGNEEEGISFVPEDLVSFDGLAGTFHFKNKQGEIHLRRKPLDLRSSFDKFEAKAEGLNL